MPVLISKYLDHRDIPRAHTIADSLGGDIQGTIGYPEIKKSWPKLHALLFEACGGRPVCTGCDYITKHVTGVVVVLQDTKGITQNAFCSAQGIKPIFFHPGTQQSRVTK